MGRGGRDSHTVTASDPPAAHGGSASGRVRLRVALLAPATMPGHGFAASARAGESLAKSRNCGRYWDRTSDLFRANGRAALPSRNCGRYWDRTGGLFRADGGAALRERANVPYL